MPLGKDGDSDSENEGFQLLFGGGVSVCDLQESAWDDPEELVDTGVSSKIFNDNGCTDMNKIVQRGGTTRGAHISHKLHQKNISGSEFIFENSFHYASDGRPMRPPVAIVDLTPINNRGNSLVATRLIRKGEIIYTERAIEATQIPQRCNKCNDDSREVATKSIALSWSSPSSYDVRACRHCFRSMEPASSLNSTVAGAKVGGVHSNESLPSIPMPHLWPVAEYEKESDGATSPIGYIEDCHRRVLCSKCGSIFCSVACKVAHNNRMGSCCKCESSIEEVIHALFCRKASAANDKKMSLTGDNADQAPDDETVSIQPAVVLGARMFCSEVNRYRTIRSNNVQVCSAEDDRGPFHGICGDPEDIQPLELGVIQKTTESSALSFTLEPAYLALCEHLTLAGFELEKFSLHFFERLVAVAARNGFSIATKSPFQSYYPALLRSVGGRGTPEHLHAMEEVARALGSTEGVLKRDMDREVADQCAAKLVALFKLTARINHSCDPCAEVRGQEFVDCHIDLVAREDIEPAIDSLNFEGREITISYINVGRTAGRVSDRNRRMRELSARYLFTCDCVRCTNDGIVK